MYSNQLPSIYATRQYTYNSQPNIKNNNNSISFDQIRSPQSSNYFPNFQSSSTIDFNDRSNFLQQRPSATLNYGSATSNRFSNINNPIRTNSSAPIGRGTSIEKTNKMSSENPFHDPARSYEHLNTTRTTTSITSPRKPSGGINKTLNLSDENPFYDIYGAYRYPSRIDPSKRITTQPTTNRSIDTKSLDLSDENPFYSIYGRYQHPTQIDTQKRLSEIPKNSGPFLPINDLSDNNRFNSNYRPSLIREYSAGTHINQVNTFPTSIADWERNHPAPLSYRPIQVQRPPFDFYNQNEPSNISSAYVPPTSPPRQQRQFSPISSPPKTQSTFSRSTPSAPLDKTSLNMSPENPFAETYGRYHYPSSEEVKVQKRTNERHHNNNNNRFIEQQLTHENRPLESTDQMTEYSDTEKKDIATGKGSTKFARFDIDF